MAEDEADAYRYGRVIQAFVNRHLFARIDAVNGFDWSHQYQRQDHGQERDGVDPVRPLQPQRGDHQSAESRANNSAHVCRDRLQAEGAAQIITGDQAGDHGLARRAVKGDGHTLDRHQHVDVPELNMSEGGQQTQGSGGEGHHHLGDDDNIAPVERVGGQTADQRKDQDRQEFGDADAADHDRVRAQVA